LHQPDGAAAAADDHFIACVQLADDLSVRAHNRRGSGLMALTEIFDDNGK